MKVLMLSAYFPPEVGSAAHLFADIGEEMLRRGHRVTVITGYPTYNVDTSTLPEKYRSGWFRRDEYKGIDVLRVRPLGMPRHVPVLRGLDQLVSAGLFALSGLVHYEGRPDVVLLYSPPLVLGLAGLVLRRFKKTKVVMNVQDLFPQQAIDLGLIHSKLLIKAFRALESYLYRHVDWVTVHSPGNKAHVVSRGGSTDRTSVAPNVVDTDLIRPGKRENTFRTRYGIPSSEFVVSFAGVLGYNQDLDTIIDAAKLLCDIPELVIYIVGDGVEKPRLLEKAKGISNVRFLPMMPKEEYTELLHASDVGLATLRKTVRTPVVPSKILSIMAAGRAVIGGLPVHGDAPALIKEANCGLCVEPENPVELARAIREMAEHRDVAAQYGVNGRRFAEMRLTLGVSVSIYEDLFKTLTNGSDLR